VVYINIGTLIALNWLNQIWRRIMTAIRKILVFKFAVVIIVLGICVAAAIPRYINMNKHAEASECIRNQVIVETALALAYAESLTVGSTNSPTELLPSMFEDGKIPACPVDGTPIAFDQLTGTAFCPHHHQSHQRIY